MLVSLAELILFLDKDLVFCASNIRSALPIWFSCRMPNFTVLKICKKTEHFQIGYAFPNSKKGLITANVCWWHWKLDVKICLQARTGKWNAFNWHSLVHRSQKNKTKQKSLFKSRLSNQSGREQHHVYVAQSLAERNAAFLQESSTLPISWAQAGAGYTTLQLSTYIATPYWRSTAKEWGRKEGHSIWRSFTSAPWDHMLRSWSLFSCRRKLWLGFYRYRNRITEVYLNLGRKQPVLFFFLKNILF